MALLRPVLLSLLLLAGALPAALPAASAHVCETREEQCRRECPLLGYERHDHPCAYRMLCVVKVCVDVVFYPRGGPGAPVLVEDGVGLLP